MKRIILFLVILALVGGAFGQSSNYPDIALSRQCPTDTGSGTAYVVTETPALVALQNGTEICFVPANANTGTTPTVNVNGLGAKTITKFGTAAVAVNDLTTTAQAILRYDGTGFELQNPQTNIVLSPVVNTTSVTVANPTAATDTILMALSLPAGYLNTVGQPFLIHGSGILSTTAASVPLVTITAKLCSVAGCGSGTVTPLAAIQSAALNTTALTNASWNYDLIATVVANGASCNLIVKGAPGMVIETGASTAAADSIYADSNTAVSSPNQNCANALFLDFFVQQSTTGASNSYKQLSGMIAPPSGYGGAGSGSGAASTIIPVAKTANYTLVVGDFQSATTTSIEAIQFTISSSTVVTATLPASAPAQISTQDPCVWIENSAASMPWELQINTNSLTLDGTAYGANKIGVDPGKAVLVCSDASNYHVYGGNLSVFDTQYTTLGAGGGAAAGNCVMPSGGPTANDIQIWSPFTLPRAIVISTLAFNQKVADAGNAEDYGIVWGAPAATGTLVAHTGAVTIGTTGNKFQALTATVVLPPGNYWTATTSAGTTAAVGCGSSTSSFVNISTNVSATTATAGAMPASISIPSAGTGTTANAAFGLQ